MVEGRVACQVVHAQILELLAHDALDDDLLQGLIDLSFRELDTTG